MLTILSEKKRRHFYNQHIGSVRNVLFEQSKTEGKMSGFTDNYLRIEMDLQEDMLNTIAPVQLHSINAEGLVDAELSVGVV
jgi:threonylcarbamoyladenosine tRNA methylthiotransferase MtaB